MSLTEGIIFGLLAMAGWGISDFFLKKISDKIGYIRALFWMSFVMTIPTVVYFLLNVGTFPVIGNYLWILVLTAFLDFCGYLFFCKALGKGPVSIIGTVSSTSIIITVILSLFFLREAITQIQGIGIVITILGILFTSFRYGDIKKMNLRKPIPGIPEDLVSVVVWGVNLVIIGFLVQNLGWFLPIMFARCGIFFFAAGYSVVKKVDLKFKQNIKSIIVLSGLASVLGFFAWSIGVNAENISLVSTISSCFPLVTIILARIFYKEKTELVQKLGMIGIISGIVIISAL
jgi:drug/metabolite transporter (DMT)-like permease